MIDKNKLQRKREETKKEILKKIKTSNRFAVVRPFGFGKTFLILELCKELKGRKIILEPNLEIIKNIKNSIPDNTECITYHSLLHKDFNYKEILKYDYIFLDEMHRTLARKWGKILKEVLNKFNGKVIGFSATPIRGDGKNVTDIIFNDEQISELTLVEAIVEEMLPNPTYVTGIYELNEKLFNNKQLKVQLKNYDLQNNLKNMFHKYLDFNKPLHIMAFSYTIEDIEQTKNYIEKWFDVPINHYIFHSRNSDEINQLELQKFKESKTGINVIHSINQLNEGIHFEKLDALIFLRKTNSDVVYLQQLGRGLSDNLHNIVVFDLMNNFLRNIKGYNRLLKEYADEHMIKIDEIKTINNEPLKIYCEQKDLIDLLEKHKDKFKHIILTDEQKNFIINNYPQKEITEISRITGISIGVLNKFLRKNKIYVKKLYSLNEKEIEYILKNHKNMSVTQIAKNLNRGCTTVLNYMNKHNIEHKRAKHGTKLTNKEKQYILENYNKIPTVKIKNHLNRSYDVIKDFARENGLELEKKIIYNNFFTKEQQEYIYKNYKIKTRNEIRKELKVSYGCLDNFYKRNNLKI